MIVIGLLLIAILIALGLGLNAIQNRLDDINDGIDTIIDKQR